MDTSGELDSSFSVSSISLNEDESDGEFTHYVDVEPEVFNKKRASSAKTASNVSSKNKTASKQSKDEGSHLSSTKVASPKVFTLKLKDGKISSADSMDFIKKFRDDSTKLDASEVKNSSGVNTVSDIRFVNVKTVIDKRTVQSNSSNIRSVLKENKSPSGKISGHQSKYKIKFKEQKVEASSKSLEQASGTEDPLSQNKPKKYTAIRSSLPPQRKLQPILPKLSTPKPHLKVVTKAEFINNLLPTPSDDIKKEEKVESALDDTLSDDPSEIPNLNNIEIIDLSGSDEEMPEITPKISAKDSVKHLATRTSQHGALDKKPSFSETIPDDSEPISPVSMPLTNNKTKKVSKQASTSSTPTSTLNTASPSQKTTITTSVLNSSVSSSNSTSKIKTFSKQSIGGRGRVTGLGTTADQVTPTKQSQGSVPAEGKATVQGKATIQGKVTAQESATSQEKVTTRESITGQENVTRQGKVTEQGKVTATGGIISQRSSTPQGTVPAQGGVAPQGTVIGGTNIPPQSMAFLPQNTIVTGPSMQPSMNFVIPKLDIIRCKQNNTPLFLAVPPGLSVGGSSAANNLLMILPHQLPSQLPEHGTVNFLVSSPLCKPGAPVQSTPNSNLQNQQNAPLPASVKPIFTSLLKRQFQKKQDNEAQVKADSTLLNKMSYSKILNTKEKDGPNLCWYASRVGKRDLEGFLYKDRLGFSKSEALQVRKCLRKISSTLYSKQVELDNLASKIITTKRGLRKTKQGPNIVKSRQQPASRRSRKQISAETRSQSSDTLEEMINDGKKIKLMEMPFLQNRNEVDPLSTPLVDETTVDNELQTDNDGSDLYYTKKVVILRNRDASTRRQRKLKPLPRIKLRSSQRSSIKLQKVNENIKMLPVKPCSVILERDMKVEEEFRKYSERFKGDFDVTNSDLDGSSRFSRKRKVDLEGMGLIKKLRRRNAIDTPSNSLVSGKYDTNLQTTVSNSKASSSHFDAADNGESYIISKVSSQGQDVSERSDLTEAQPKITPESKKGVLMSYREYQKITKLSQTEIRFIFILNTIQSLEDLKLNENRPMLILDRFNYTIDFAVLHYYNVLFTRDDGEVVPTQLLKNFEFVYFVRRGLIKVVSRPVLCKYILERNDTMISLAEKKITHESPVKTTKQGSTQPVKKEDDKENFAKTLSLTRCKEVSKKGAIINVRQDLIEPKPSTSSAVKTVSTKTQLNLRSKQVKAVGKAKGIKCIPEAASKSKTSKTSRTKSPAQNTPVEGSNNLDVKFNEIERNLSKMFEKSKTPAHDASAESSEVVDLTDSVRIQGRVVADPGKIASELSADLDYLFSNSTEENTNLDNSYEETKIDIEQHTVNVSEGRESPTKSLAKQDVVNKSEHESPKTSHSKSSEVSPQKVQKRNRLVSTDPIHDTDKLVELLVSSVSDSEETRPDSGTKDVSNNEVTEETSVDQDLGITADSGTSATINIDTESPLYQDSAMRLEPGSKEAINNDVSEDPVDKDSSMGLDSVRKQINEITEDPMDESSPRTHDSGTKDVMNNENLEGSPALDSFSEQCHTTTSEATPQNEDVQKTSDEPSRAAKELESLVLEAISVEDTVQQTNIQQVIVEENNENTPEKAESLDSGKEGSTSGAIDVDQFLTTLSEKENYKEDLDMEQFLTSNVKQFIEKDESEKFMTDKSAVSDLSETSSNMNVQQQGENLPDTVAEACALNTKLASLDTGLTIENENDIQELGQSNLVKPTENVDTREGTGQEETHQLGSPESEHVFDNRTAGDSINESIGEFDTLNDTEKLNIDSDKVDLSESENKINLPTQDSGLEGVSDDSCEMDSLILKDNTSSGSFLTCGSDVTFRTEAESSSQNLIDVADNTDDFSTKNDCKNLSNLADNIDISPKDGRVDETLLNDSVNISTENVAEDLLGGSCEMDTDISLNTNEISKNLPDDYLEK